MPGPPGSPVRKDEFLAKMQSRKARRQYPYYVAPEGDGSGTPALSLLFMKVIDMFKQNLLPGIS
jgi:hypothetical protein